MSTFGIDVDSSGGLHPDGADLHNLENVFHSLSNIEQNVLDHITEELKSLAKGEGEKRDRTKCDEIFGYFSTYIVVPLINFGLSSRAAIFSANRLIPSVLTLENELGIEFHKGALFYDSALCFLFCGDDSRFDLLLAMTSEEDKRTHAVEGKEQDREIHNKRLGELTSQTIKEIESFFAQICNGNDFPCACRITDVLGDQLTVESFRVWRSTLDGFHHVELIRNINELMAFGGKSLVEYEYVSGNPQVFAKLTKVLAHLAQWGESRLTGSTGSLHPKLKNDPQLVSLRTASGNNTGGNPNCPGDSANGAAVDSECKKLLGEIQSATDPLQRAWRCVRIFYIVRNATAHKIDSTLDFYSDREYLLKLIHATILATLVIEEQYGRKVVKADEAAT